MNLYVSKITPYVKPLSFSLIMARDDRGGIGMSNDLPWKLAGVRNKSDMAWFRENTLNKVIVMGYNTWVSLGRKPLPNRTNIIISAAHHDEVKADIEQYNKTYLDNNPKDFIASPTVMVFHSPELAIKRLKHDIHGDIVPGEVMVIGGAKIYEAFLPMTSRIYLTTFEGEFEADTFVQMDLSKWDLIYRDARKCLEPKFEIWDCNEEAAKTPDEEFMQISHDHKPAAGWVAETIARIEAEKDK